MILKDVVVSKERVRWPAETVASESGVSQRLDADQVLPSAEMADAPLPEVYTAAAGVPLAAATVDLTPESVVEWLGRQPAESRAAFAQALAPIVAREWEPELEAHVEAARQGGYEEGRQSAMREVKARFESAVQVIESAAQQSDEAFAQELTQLSERCAEIVVAAIAKIAGPHLLTPEAALGAVLTVAERLRDERDVTLRVHADDLLALEANRGRIERALAGRRFSLLADSRIELGGCIIDSDLGSLDGRLELQLRGLFETLRAARAGMRGASA